MQPLITILTQIKNNIAPDDLTNLLMQYWELNSDADLTRELELEDRRKVHQYRKRKGTDDIQYRIIVSLLRDIGYLETQLAQYQSS